MIPRQSTNEQSFFPEFLIDMNANKKKEKVFVMTVKNFPSLNADDLILRKERIRKDYSFFDYRTSCEPYKWCEINLKITFSYLSLIFDFLMTVGAPKLTD